MFQTTNQLVVVGEYLNSAILVTPGFTPMKNSHHFFPHEIPIDCPKLLNTAT